MSFTNQEAAHLLRSRVSFGFGENWKKYISTLSESTIRQAEDSFSAFTRTADMSEHTFLDVGCGSGLNSLVAHRLGAKRVVSVDVDPNCIDCVSELRTRFAAKATNWEVKRCSVLARDFHVSVGKFSYVYSWGVLHHTGAMWQAVENVTKCVEANGILHLALYNESRHAQKWHKIKKLNNRFPRTVFPTLKMIYIAFIYGRLLARLQSPREFNRNYRQKRGMEFRRDVDDWFGGLPYEYCKPDQVIDFFSDRGFLLERLRTALSHGCNEFLFRSSNTPSKHSEDAGRSSSVPLE